MKTAALLVALFTIGVGIVGFVSPDSLTAVRQAYFATPGRLYPAIMLRAAMGVAVILAASASRAPRILRALGALMCMQALSAALFGPDRARAIVEWETMQGHAILRVGAAVAFASGCFMAFALTGRRHARQSPPV